MIENQRLSHSRNQDLIEVEEVDENFEQSL